MQAQSPEYKNIEAHTPILVGVAALSERGEDPHQMRDTAHMLCDVSRLALLDAACDARHLDLIMVPQGSWVHSNPPGVLAGMLGATRAHTVQTELGILQQGMFSYAAQAIQRGERKMALIAGAETRLRDRLAARAGVELPPEEAETTATQTPNETLRPDGELTNPIEAGRGLLFPVSAYAIIENAFCHERGLDPQAARNEIDMLWSDMSGVAKQNPDAWAPHYLDPAAVRAEPDMSMPYTRAHVSQWNLNQGAALVMCSVEIAREMGISPSQWIFPWGSAESNHMQTVCERTYLHRCLGMEHAARAGLEAAEVHVKDIDLWDLYSCFPIAVRLQQKALGLDADSQVTITGGMSFAGGPLNNYSLQSMVKMAQALRTKKTCGVVSSVSGILHKYGIGVWSAVPPSTAYRHVETPRTSAIAPKPKKLLEHFSGKGIIAGYTVNYRDGDRPRLIAVIDTSDGRHRALATSEDPQLIARGEQNYLSGVETHVKDDMLIAEKS
jgi:acetyl-CoA C-acetyltransferase